MEKPTYENLPEKMQKMVQAMVEILTEEAEIERVNQAEYDKLTHKQKLFLVHWERIAATNISRAARMTRICRDTVYRWRKENPSFAEFMDSVKPEDIIRDDAEYNLLKAIREGKERSVHFALERLDKKKYSKNPNAEDIDSDVIWHEEKTYDNAPLEIEENTKSDNASYIQDVEHEEL